MHRCQQFLFPFTKCSNKSGHYQPSVFVAEAAVTCAIHEWTLLGKKSPRNKFVFVKDWHKFPKIIQDSLSKHLAATVEKVSELLLCREKSALSQAQFYEDVHAVLACVRRASQKILIFWSLSCIQSLSPVQGWHLVSSCPVPHCIWDVARQVPSEMECHQAAASAQLCF